MSFRLKTIFGIALIEIALLAVLVVSGLSYLRKSSEAELLSRGDVTAQLFATMTSDAVLSVDLATLDALVEQTLRNDGIVYVRVRNQRGVVLSEGGDSAALSAAFEADESIKTASKDGRLDVSAAIIAAGEVFGHVELGLSTDHLQQVIAQARQWMLTIAASEIVIVAIFGVILGTVLTRQLARLRAAAKRVAQGEFGHQLAVIGRDELADTTQSFNRMSSALADFAREAEAAREKAEAGQAYAETVLNDAMNSMPQSVVIVSSDRRVTFANESFNSCYPGAFRHKEGRAKYEDVASRSLLTTVTEGDEQVPFSLVERMRRLDDAENNRKWRGVAADGKMVVTTQERMSDGGVVIVENDVTELFAALERNRQLELELMQTQKLESLGTMAGGIAHEINTPVQFVGDNLKFLEETFCEVATVVNELSEGETALATTMREKLDDLDWEFVKDEIPSAFGEARTGIGTVGEIVKSIKEFAHPDSDAKIAQDLEKIIQNTLTVSRNQWRHHAEIECAIDPGLDAVPCFAGKLSQVLISLIVNAADAIEEGARIEKGQIRVAARRRGDVAEISVSDNGPGVPSDKIDNIFDMFFTTKAPGKGTGQGLAICKRIIEANHGGELTVESSPGEGARFIVRLPMHDQQCAA
ncbi:MAG: ATP-binding protein [Pseudomonadota bacterium]